MQTTKQQFWNTFEAKDKLSKLLSDAQEKEQIIMKYGKPFAVVVSYKDYIANKNNSLSVWDAFKDIKLKEEFILPERSETMREIEL